MPICRCNIFKVLFILLTIPLFSSTAISANNQNIQTLEKTLNNNDRPKIGLVLSGGGARGFAHIGVLKVLEENKVPIDYIVGTSMGSIIGGLYAIGLTPDEIEQGVNSITWDKVFSDFAYRDFKTFRRKKDDFDFFNIHRIGINSNGLQVAPGLIEGQQIELALDRLAFSGFHINDYDKLRIPYRAVATDIASGEPFIIKSGNIARAMRASMSIPGALPPITIDDKLLVDGGIANNIPIDIAREMGADIIIVVDVSAPLEKKQAIKSSIDVTGQLVTILTRRIADIQLETLEKDDVLIVPGEEQISSSDFSSYPALIEAGIVATNEKRDAIKKLSLSDQSYREYISSLPVVKNKNPVIDFIRIENDTRLSDDVMQVRIHQEIGQPLDIAQLERDLSYIYGLDFSSSVVYSLEQRDNRTGLIIYIRDRKWANSYLQFGLSVKSESNIGSFTNVDAAFIKQNLNNLAGEFRATLGLGSEPKLSGELYQPFDANLDSFISAKTGIATTIFPEVSSKHINSIQRFHRNYIELSAGKIFKQTSELRLGIHYSEGRTAVVSGVTPILTAAEFKEGYYYARFSHDSLDNLSFPNTGSFSGVTFRANKENLKADSDYQQLQLLVSGAGTYGRYSVFSRAMLESSIDANAPYNALFRHGGFLELSGTLERELSGQHFGLAEVLFYRRLGDISYLPIYTGFSLETGNVFDQRTDINTDNLILAGSLFIGADTFLGPLYFALGVNDDDNIAIYFNLGKTFLDTSSF